MTILKILSNKEGHGDKNTFGNSEQCIKLDLPFLYATKAWPGPN